MIAERIRAPLTIASTTLCNIYYTYVQPKQQRSQTYPNTNPYKHIMWIFLVPKRNV